MKTYLLTVTGLVQGVGMRPTVCLLGKELGLKGLVRNSGGIVEIEVNLDSWAVDDFIHRLYQLCNNSIKIDNISYKEIASKDFYDFTVEESSDSEILPALPYDFGVCDECLKVLNNPKDRRYKYPFITCTTCGPRYTLMRRVPYDRANTTMDAFPMCDKCREEYFNSDSRYFYAQTLSCPECGPRLCFYNTASSQEKSFDNDAFVKAVDAIKQGEVVAVKNVGGFHFVCDATNESAVSKVRAYKKRMRKPLAVCFLDIEKAKQYAKITPKLEEALTSDKRPIVLCDQASDKLPEIVSMNSDKIGVMLPANALQYMLLSEFEALVMTSANISSEPIIIDDKDLQGFDKLFVLTNNREIITPVDDSILYEKCGKLCVLRRARGYVPEAIETNVKAPKTTLLLGADMKGSIGIAKDNKLFMSQCLGDMESERVFAEAKSTIKRFEANHSLTPEKVVSDAHPNYYSNQLNKVDSEVYHHEAHAAAVILEHKFQNERVLAFALDGTGYGRDGSIWGSEAFICQGGSYEHVASLKPYVVVGGDEASKDGRLVLASILLAALRENSQNADIIEREINSLGFTELEIDTIKGALDTKIGTYNTSSMGRMFDAVSALLDVCRASTYEGEAAIELEYCARKANRDLSTKIAIDGLIVNNQLDTTNVIIQLIKKKKEGFKAAQLAYAFHTIISEWIAHCAKAFDLDKVVLSGGSAANVLLCELVYEKLANNGKELYFSEAIPPGDDGITLGQLLLSLNR